MSKDTTLQTVAEHYESLRGFLAAHIQKLMRESGQVKSRSASARQKLMNLNKSQFQELSTDVYDEMMRRTDEHPCMYKFIILLLLIKWYFMFVY